MRMGDLNGRAPHAEVDARRSPDPDRANIPEGLRRERKSAYGPTTGRRGERVKSEKTRQAGGMEGAEKN
jgi:hypothetical protein